MNCFSKKTETLLVAASVVLLLSASALVLFSGNLLYFLEEFLSSKVFHREFSLDKWGDTLNALIAFPVFAVVFVDAVLWVKFSNKNKVILVLFYGFVFLVFMAFCAYTRSSQFVDSDMASEILLAKECFLQKSFWPFTWNYSTEIRLINTQLLTAPLFIFTSSWIVVKAISVVLISLCLPLSLYFLLCQLEIKSVWLKLLSCLFVFCPWSSEMWRIVHFGSYYVPHIALAFVFIGLFLAAFYRNVSVKKKKIYIILFYFVAFTSGLAGIRHILYFIFPLAVVLVACAVSSLFKEKRSFEIKTFFLENKALFSSLVALVVGGFGYILNSTLLSKLFSFAQFYTTAFNSIGDVGYYEVKNAVLGILGYKNMVSVFTPSGIINILLYVALAFFILCFISAFKTKIQDGRKIFLLFSVVMFFFNSFVFINTEYIARYFILPLVFIVPCLACFVEEDTIHPVKRYLMLFCFSVVFISGAFVTYGNILTQDQNADKRGAANFVLQNDYDFGYATFWNANVFTFLTDGQLEMCNLNREEKDGKVFLDDSLLFDKWLTPERYYAEGVAENKKVILLVSEAEFENNSDYPAFKGGSLVYNDGFYRIYEYENANAFRQSYVNR